MKLAALTGFPFLGACHKRLAGLTFRGKHVLELTGCSGGSCC